MSSRSDPADRGKEAAGEFFKNLAGWVWGTSPTVREGSAGSGPLTNPSPLQRAGYCPLDPVKSGAYVHSGVEKFLGASDSRAASVAAGSSSTPGGVAR